MLRLLELEKAVVEGSGATTVAALFTGKLDYLKGKKYNITLYIKEKKQFNAVLLCYN